jgi:hypothetical protein
MDRKVSFWESQSCAVLEDLVELVPNGPSLLIV